MKRMVCRLMVAGVLLGASASTLAQQTWPHPIPCRIEDGDNPDLFMMTLGDVETSLAQGIYDPVKDQVTLKDGSTKENYYKEVLGLPYYQPIDKTHYPLPPSGWCTWYFYYYHITGAEVKANAKWLADNLKDYGASVVQIDDGWQRGPGSTRDWTLLHKGYFPDGMADVATYIKSVGLVPGIWLAPHGQDNPELVARHPNVFLLNEDGESASSTWEGKWLVDPTTPESEAYMKDLFRTLCDWGYDYFKIDGQPIVVREYATKKQFMKNPQDDTDGLYRKTLAWMREVIGPDRYLLGCWGIPTEGAGIMDGSRTGGDIVLGWGGFQTALRAVMAYYYQHNIMWYVDPDVMVLRSPLTVDQARVWATLQGLTGQALMATDRMMDLGEERVEMLRRVYPAVNIRPLDLFPAGRNKRIWDLKVNHLGRQYDVVGLFNFDESAAEQMPIKWADLGLPSDRPLHVFDFWNSEYLGAWEAGMVVDLPPTSCRVLTVLPSTGEIHLISTNRHITQGWVDLTALSRSKTGQGFRGTSRVVKNDPYELYFAFPKGKNFQIERVTARSAGAELPVTVANHQGWAVARIHSPQTTEVVWDVQFKPADMYAYPTQAPTNPRVERVGLDGVNLTWNEQYYLNVGYQVYLNGKLQGYTPKAAFPLRGLDPKATYTVGVETVWEDGTASREKAELSFSIASLAPRQMPLSQLQPVISGGRRRGFLGAAANGPISIGGKSYQDAIILRPGSEVTYEIKGLYDSVSALVGIGDESNVEGSVEFVLLGDGKELWRSGSLTTEDGAKPVQADIQGVQSLELRVEGSTGGARRGMRGRRGGAAAAWVDVTLSRS